ncbi:hypothetical protein [Bacillus salipaludis]|uniref:Cell wall-binding protein n=1 Tax=Bacillus salipaludis TaxID=2547811 RepID=A0ABW8RLB7_9BACI
MWYYYDLESGQKQTGWIKDKNNWYYLDNSGVMKTGWIKDNNNWYYLDGSGPTDIYSYSQSSSPN